VPEVVTSLARWRELTEGLRARGARVGVTLTMGDLHAGHASLLERARAECDASLLTIFVNPLQFNDGADLAAYHRDLEADLGLAVGRGVDAVLAPPLHEMWPDWPAQTATSVHVSGLTELLEGADRPGHFDGVASVVTKLLVATGPCAAYFGEKDFQQLCVVRRLVADLALPVEVVGCATVREPDGLALSSRNARLSDGGRAAALVLHRALDAGRAALGRGGGPAEAEAAMRATAATEPRVALAYAAAVEPATLRAPTACAPGTELRLLVAGVVEGVRLIDNVAAVVRRAP
jgi:pantoate--beta-alanine ligase